MQEWSFTQACGAKPPHSFSMFRADIVRLARKTNKYMAVAYAHPSVAAYRSEKQIKSVFQINRSLMEL